jgi:hypothetical protein
MDEIETLAKAVADHERELHVREQSVALLKAEAREIAKKRDAAASRLALLRKLGGLSDAEKAALASIVKP